MPASPRRRGGQPGNSNNFKHGFYSRRLKKRDLTGVDATDTSGLVEEIALIRIFTRRMVETFDPDAGFYEHADLLRILCIASSAITRIIRAHALINATGPGMAEELRAAIHEANLELLGDPPDPLLSNRAIPSTPAVITGSSPIDPAG